MPFDSPTISDSVNLPRSREQDSLYTSGDMQAFDQLFKPAKTDVKSCDLPEVELTLPLQDYGRMLGEELNSGMSDQQLGETFKQFAEKYGNEVYSATTDVRTYTLAAIETDFNFGLEGTGFTVRPDWETNEMHLMKGDTDLGAAMFGCPQHYE